MAKHIVKYLLEGDGSIPKYIEKGGYFPKGNYMIGITVDDEVRFVPPYAEKLKKSEILKWVKDGKPIDTKLKKDKTDPEISEMLEAFLALVGKQDHA